MLPVWVWTVVRVGEGRNVHTGIKLVVCGGSTAMWVDLSVMKIIPWSPGGGGGRGGGRLRASRKYEKIASA